MGENPSSISTKQDLIDYTATEWNALVAYVDGLTADQWIGPKDAAGWSVKDHVSHVTKWDRAVIELLRNDARLQETFGIADTAWSADSDDPMNEQIRKLAVNDSVQMVKAERDATWTDLMSLLDDLSEDQLARPGVDVGLAIGERALPDPVLLVLVDYFGAHYDEHLHGMKTLVDGDPE